MWCLKSIWETQPEPEDCPPTEDMIRSEIMWVLQSGIDLIGDIVEVES